MTLPGFHCNISLQHKSTAPERKTINWPNHSSNWRHKLLASDHKDMEQH